MPFSIPPQSNKQTFLKITRLTITAVMAVPVVGLLFVSVAAFAGRFVWFFDLWSHFRWHYFMAAAPLTLITLLMRRTKLAALALVVTVINGLHLLPFVTPSLEASPSDATTVRLMMANTLYGNPNPDMLIEAVLKTSPDIVVLVEMNRINHFTMGALWERYAYVQSDPQYQTVILSRYPLENGRFIDYGSGHRSQAYAEITVQGRSFGVLGIHPTTPMNNDRWGWRNEELQKTAAFAREQQLPIIVTGDFNVSSFSPNFTHFLKEGELTDGRVGQGLNRSWPTFMPAAKIPIDHFVSSPAINVISLETGPHTGSDHLPLVVDFIIEDY